MSLSIKAARMGARGAGPSAPMGDPGLFGFLGKVGKGIIRGVGRELGLGRGPAAVPHPQQQAAFGRPPMVNLPFRGPRGVGFGGPVRVGIGERMAVNGVQVKCGKGERPNKSSYFLRDGTFVPEGSRCVKIRRRNPMNPRALDRAIGRMNSAKRLQSKLAGFSTKKYTATGKRKDKC